MVFEVTGAASSVPMLGGSGRFLLVFRVDGVSALLLYDSGIFPAGESGDQGAFPTPIMVAYITMIRDIVNHKSIVNWES